MSGYNPKLTSTFLKVERSLNFRHRGPNIVAPALAMVFIKKLPPQEFSLRRCFGFTPTFL